VHPTRLDRRAFLKGAAVTGAISVAAGTLRAKLSHVSAITVAVGDDAVGLLQMLGRLFTASSGVPVRVEPAGLTSSAQLKYMDEHAGKPAGDPEAVDVFGVDVAHMRTLVERDRLQRHPDDNPISFLPEPLLTCQVTPKDGQRPAGFYGLPFYTNVGMLFRRAGVGRTRGIRCLTDLLTASAGPTWVAQLATTPDNGEGLLCNFFEHVLAVPGCEKLVTPGPLQLNEDSWNTAADLIRDARRLRRCENDGQARDIFNEGGADFMRNWPTYLHQKAGSVPPVPAILMPAGHGILGGVNLAVARNARDSTAARDFIAFSTGPDAQKIVALHNYPPVLSATYNDPEVARVATHLATVKNAIADARIRPASTDHEQFMNAVVTVIAAVLGDRTGGTRIFRSDIENWNRFL
jgi:hypothetical protein